MGHGPDSAEQQPLLLRARLTHTGRGPEALSTDAGGWSMFPMPMGQNARGVGGGKGEGELFKRYHAVSTREKLRQKHSSHAAEEKR